MGIEYRILCAARGLPAMVQFLQRMGGQSSYEHPDRFEFRFASTDSNVMPDATVIVESESIYFLDSLGDRAQVALLFHAVIDEALTYADESDSTTVTAL
jgi:hypothetical protein